MIHAKDSFLKHMATALQAQGITSLSVDPEGKLPLDSVSVIFLTTHALVGMNPPLSEWVVSLDVMAEGDTSAMARRKADLMAMAVDKALKGPWIKKQDWTIPAVPVDLGTYVSWRPWGSWRRVTEPNERYAHLNKTLSLRFVGETV